MMKKLGIYGVLILLGAALQVSAQTSPNLLDLTKQAQGGGSSTTFLRGGSINPIWSPILTFQFPAAVIDEGGQVYNVKAYGATGNGSTDDTAAIQSAITAAIMSTSGSTVFFPSGTYKINSTVTDSYTTHSLLVDHGLHLSISGYGATLNYAVNTAANVIELRGSANCNVEGLKIVSANANVGTGINLIRPTSIYGDPTEKNVLHNLDLRNLSVAIQNGNNDNNQVSENTFDDIRLNIPSGGQGVVQQGTSNFNSDYRNITFYGPTSASAILLHLYNGTASCLRCTFEMNGGNTGIQAETYYTGPFDFYGHYAEVATDTDLFFKTIAGGGYFNFFGGTTSFFGTGGTTGAPITQFEVSAGGTFSFHNSNFYVAGGMKSFNINGGNAIITRYGGYWGSLLEYFGSTADADLVNYGPYAPGNLPEVDFRCNGRVTDSGSPTDLFIESTASCGGSPIPQMRFGNNVTQLLSATFDPPSNGSGAFGYGGSPSAGMYFGNAYFSNFAVPSIGSYVFENYAGTGTVLGMNKDSSDMVHVGGSAGVNLATGTNLIYRCATAGVLPVGALTIYVAGNCGTYTSTGITAQ